MTLVSAFNEGPYAIQLVPIECGPLLQSEALETSPRSEVWPHPNFDTQLYSGCSEIGYSKFGRRLAGGCGTAGGPYELVGQQSFCCRLWHTHPDLRI